MKSKSSLKKILIFMLAFLLCNIFLFSTFHSSVKLIVSNKSKVTSPINFFFDNSKSDYPFDDSHLSPSIPLIGDGKLHEISYSVPRKDLNKLRIDFGTESGTFEVHSFYIILSPIYKINISGKDFLDTFSNINDIDDYSVIDGIVRIHTSGSDGHIYSLKLLENSSKTLRSASLLEELIIIVISLLIAFYSFVIFGIKFIVAVFIKQLRTNKHFINSKQSIRIQIIGFIITVIYSVIGAILLDVIVFRGIAIIAQLAGFDTLNQYFSPALLFSFGRIYFLFIFFFIIGLVRFIGIRKSIRYRYALAGLFLILMVLGRFTGSSLGYYDEMLHGNTAEYKNSTLLGIPQGIRGDEWATEKPYYFAQVMAHNDMPYFNKNLSFDGTDMVVSAFAPVKDIVTLARPDLWGFLILPPEYAFSFYWIFRLVLLFLASFEMGLLLSKRYRYALVAAIVITFAPAVQWWLSQALMLMLMSGQFALVLFNKYLNSIRRYSKVFCLLGIGFFVLVYTLTMYPATQVPLAYIFLAVFIHLIIVNREKQPLSPGRIIQYILAMIPFLLILVHFYIKSSPAMHVIVNTVYPGTNRPWIKLPWDFDLYQFVNVFTAIIRQPDFLNASEISQFYSFLPFVILSSIFLVSRYRNKALLPALILSASLLLWFISWLPQIPIFNKLTLLSFTYPARITYACGFGFTLTIISLLPVLEKRIKVFSFKTASLIAGTICFLTLCVLTNSDNVFHYFKTFIAGTILMILIVILFSYMGYSLIRGGKKRIRQFGVLLVIVTIGSTFMVNPITQGMDSMFEKTTMKKIREINAEDSGRWMVSGSPTISNLVTAQGVARTTGTYYYPDWTMMGIIDKKHRFENLWNQYAHIDMRLTDKSLDFSIIDREKSEKVDGTNRIIYIPIETVKELKIKYIFTTVPIPQSIIDKGQVTLLYKDAVDPWSIYRVNY